MARLSFFLLLIVLAGQSALHAGDIKHISITYEYKSDNPNETPDQAERHALERARLKAMEENFGVDVTGVSSILQHNQAQGTSSQSSTDVFALNETAVRGEWIETIREEVQSKTYEQGFWRVKVYVEGKARNHSNALKTEVKYAFVNNINDTENRALFNDGDDFFLHFSSPAGGSLCVYLIDEEHNAFCILPYQSSQSGYQQIDANEKYLFFSTSNDKKADEYTLNAQRQQERNAVYIVFTPHTLVKASDNQGGTNWQGEQMPRQLSYKDFLSWLSRNQTRDEDMVVLTEVLTIERKN